MKEDQLVEIWLGLKEYLDKKSVELAAEKYVDILADYGVDDITFKDSLGHDEELDEAISYYLDLDNDEDD